MNIYQRLAAVMKEVSYVQKERKPGMRYSIISHDTVTEKVRPLFVAHGIVSHPVGIEASQDGNRTQVQLTVRFASVDDPKDFIDVPSLGYGIDDQDKGPGKAISYAVKYAMLKTLGLETGDDPDEHQDVKHEPKADAASDDLRAAYERIKKAINKAMTAKDIDQIMLAQQQMLGKMPRAGFDALMAYSAKRKTDLTAKDAA